MAGELIQINQNYCESKRISSKLFRIRMNWFDLTKICFFEQIEIDVNLYKFNELFCTDMNWFKLSQIFEKN